MDIGNKNLWGRNHENNFFKLSTEKLHIYINKKLKEIKMSNVCKLDLRDKIFVNHDNKYTYRKYW